MHVRQSRAGSTPLWGEVPQYRLLRAEMVGFSRPLIILPSMQSAMTFELVAVHMMIFAPPRAWSASAEFCALESI